MLNYAVITVMKLSRQKHITFKFICVSLLFSINSVASENKQEFNLTEIAEANFVHTGLHVSIDDEEHDDIANIGFIIGNKCVAVIDTGGSIKIGQQLFKSIRSKTDKPVCYVINTHIHFDHILGNKVFESAKTKFVGHHKLAEAVEQNKSFFLEYYQKDLGDNPDESSIIGPNILVDKKVQLDLGGRTLTLIPYQVSHSHNDLVVIDDKTKTLWAGDLIFRQRIPILTGSLKGWLKVIEQLNKLDINHVIPGHGAVAVSIEQAIERQHQYLTLLLKETRKSLTEGQFVNEAMESIDKDNQLNWLLHEHHHPGNVSKAYTELEWE
jgi:quinoprotein relay system zinc metallohydrolase 2